ncbi:hypothetical protein INR49_001285 [Caranx melampygus]|nr:hypothetical protein INR49_001285 [Caranx melampygus]
MLNWIFPPVTLSVFVLVLWATSADALTYKKTGDTVVLSLDPVTENINKIIWKHNTDLAMEWISSGSKPDSYRQFKDRGSLNISTGAMTITGLTVNDSGTYTPEINDRVRSPTELRVITPVPKTHYTKSCKEEDERICNYTCEAGDDKNAEPITSVWISNLETWTSTGTLSITPDMKQAWFRCVLKNPVSEERGEEISNPFAQRVSASRMQIGLIISFVLLVVVVIILIVIWKECRGKREPGTQDENVVLMSVETGNHQDTSNHNPVSSVTRETDIQETSAGNQISAGNHTSEQDQTSAEEKTSAENPASADDQTSAENPTSAENRASADDQTSAEGQTSAEDQTSAENPASADDQTSAEGQTSAEDQTSAENPTSAEKKTSAENPASAEDQTSAENPASADDQTSAEGQTSAEDQTSAENPTSAEKKTSAENLASAEDQTSTEGQTSAEDQTSLRAKHLLRTKHLLRARYLLRKKHLLRTAHLLHPQAPVRTQRRPRRLSHMTRHHPIRTNLQIHTMATKHHSRILSLLSLSVATSQQRRQTCQMTKRHPTRSRGRIRQHINRMRAKPEASTPHICLLMVLRGITSQGKCFLGAGVNFKALLTGDLTPRTAV